MWKSAPHLQSDCLAPRHLLDEVAQRVGAIVQLFHAIADLNVSDHIRPLQSCLGSGTVWPDKFDGDIVAIDDALLG